MKFKVIRMPQCGSIAVFRKMVIAKIPNTVIARTKAVVIHDSDC